ncbi:MAG: flagellar filament capping protein FliD [Pseudomonadota bacterium]
MTTVTSSVSSPGIGSGLDVSNIVSQLVAASRAAPDKRLAAATEKDNTTISALGSLKSALSALQTATKAMGSTGTLGKSTAQSSDSSTFTASTSGGSSATYNVEVVSLATASKIASSSYATAATEVGAGSVTIGVGASSFTVNLTASANKLSDLVSAINGSADNKGVTASIVTDNTGSRLVLQSQKTGTDNAVTLSSAATVGGGSFISTSVLQTAANAQLKIDGYDVTSNLVKANPGATNTLTIAPNTSAAAGAVQDFVTAYNSALSTIAGLTKFDPTGQSSGALLGDSTAQHLMTQLRSIVGGAASETGSAFQLLSQIGISSSKDGTLTLDTTALNSALSTDIGSVQKMFSGSGGFGVQLSSLLTSTLTVGGSIDSKMQGLQTDLKDIAKQKTALDTRMSAEETRLLAQYSALDTLVATLKSTQDYLTQQLDNLPGWTTKSN